jgi:hypothetical protein
LKKALVLLLFLAPAAAFADEPATSYIFPAGGPRGSTVDCRVGGMNLSGECGFRMPGGGVEAPPTIRSMPTLTLPGPYHQNPIAQQAFDYPKYMAAAIKISADAVPGVRYWYCTTSEGASQLRCFVIGDLPEVLEDERKTVQGRPQKLTLPVTVNGRIYPRGDLDEYEFSARAGDVLSAEVLSQRLGHKLDARLELFDAAGRPVAAIDGGSGADPMLIATLPAAGRYVLRIHDLAYEGNQDYVYRLTLRIGPCISHLFPAGGRRGELSRVRLYGAGLAPEGFVDRELLLDAATFPALDPAAGGGGLVLVSGREISSMMTEPAGPGAPRPGAVRGSPPLSRSFQLGDLPEVIEVEPNEGPGRAQRVALPAVLNGQILTAGDVDEFLFAATKGQKIDFDLYGRRLGSPLTAVAAVLDSTGKQLARQEGDGALSFAAPGDGDYTLRIHELHRETHGGSEYLYRIVAAPTRPAFRLVLEKETLAVLPGQGSKIKLSAFRTGGFAGDIDLEFRDLPAGVKAAPALIPAAAKQIEVTFSASADAPVGDTRRTGVVGGATIEGRRVARAAELPVIGSLPGQPPADSLALTVSHPPLFTIETEEIYGFANRGTAYSQKFTITRLAGFDGDIELALADRQLRYLQGVTGPTILVRSGEKEAIYPAFLPESMDLNRTSRIVLTGTARVGGRTVTHTTKKQIVVRVSPAILTLSAERDDLEAAVGRELLVGLRLARTRELSGPVTVEAVLPEDARGITARSVEVPEGQETVQMALKFAPGATLGDQDRLLFRASGRRGGHPVIAETSVRIELETPR